MSEPPAIVIYMIDPFSFGVDNLELQRLSSLAMMRSFTTNTTNITRSTRLLRQLCLVSLHSGHETKLLQQPGQDSHRLRPGLGCREIPQVQVVE